MKNNIFKSLNCVKYINLKKIKGKSFSTAGLDTNIKNFNQQYVELRSDVKTQPTEKMKQSIQNSIYGDDSVEEDPTMNKLMQKCCELFGKERALFVPTGTMGNLLSHTIHSPNKNYILQGERSHLNKIEQGGRLFGFKQLLTPSLDIVPENIDIKKEISYLFTKQHPNIPQSQYFKLIDTIHFENTHNFASGKIMNMHFYNKIRQQILKDQDLSHIKFHLDGSRILNAAVSLNCDPKPLVKDFNTVNVCFSKAVGAPIGSVILMNEKDYPTAKNIRKLIGGTMRQAGWVAAPVLIALEDWRERLSNDHKNALYFYQELSKISLLKVSQPDSNIVNVNFDERKITSLEQKQKFLKLLQEEKVLALLLFNEYIRTVFHHQVSREQTDKAINAFRKVSKLFD
jgi:threonine aldolase